MSKLDKQRNGRNGGSLPPLPKLRPRPGLKPPVRFPPESTSPEVTISDPTIISIEGEISNEDNSDTTQKAIAAYTPSKNSSLSDSCDNLCTKSRTVSKTAKLEPETQLEFFSKHESPIQNVSLESNSETSKIDTITTSSQSLSIENLTPTCLPSSIMHGYKKHISPQQKETETEIAHSLTKLVCPPPMLGSTQITQRPPHYNTHKSSTITAAIRSQSNFSLHAEALQQKTEDQTGDKTSRLLMKTDCKGGRGGRKRNGDGNSSLVHSIPKFSEVVPKGGKMSAVQKVLQSRLLLKQREKHEKSLQQLTNGKTEVLDQVRSQNNVKSSLVLNSLFQVQPTPTMSTPAKKPKFNNNCSSDMNMARNSKFHNIDLKASNILQNIISLHEQNNESGSEHFEPIDGETISLSHPKILKVKTPDSLLSMQSTKVFKSENNSAISVHGIEKAKTETNGNELMHIPENINNRRKSRKPSKREICRLVQENEVDNNEKECVLSSTTISQNEQNSDNVYNNNTTMKSQIQHQHHKNSSLMEEKPATVHLSPEVTITPTKMVVQRGEIKINSDSSTTSGNALNGTKPRMKSRKPHDSKSTKLSINQSQNGANPIESHKEDMARPASNDVQRSHTNKLAPILSPEEYDERGLPSGYIYWPTGNVFVHPSTIPEHFLSNSSIFGTPKNNTPEDKNIEDKKEDTISNINHSKYRRILPKSPPPCTKEEGKTEILHHSPKKVDSSSTASHLQNNMLQFTR